MWFNKSTQSKAPRPARMQVEHLEDRLTPAAAGVQLVASYPLLQPSQTTLDGLYQNILGHEPDSVGLAYWNQQLANGVSTGTIANTIWTSTEHRTLEVEQMFNQLLGRPADQAAVNYFDAQFQAGANEQTVMNSIIQSGEFTGGTSDNVTFVNNLYEKVLGRAPDGGAAYWDAQLQTGAQTQAQVSMAFINSTEASTDLVDNLYLNLLNRPASSGDEAYWDSSIQSGASYQSVAVNIMGSAEYLSLVNSSAQVTLPPQF